MILTGPSGPSDDDANRRNFNPPNTYHPFVPADIATRQATARAASTLRTTRRLRFHGIIDRRHPGAGPVFAPTVHGSAWPAALSVKHCGQPRSNAKRFVALKRYAGTRSRVSPPSNKNHFAKIATAASGSMVITVPDQSISRVPFVLPCPTSIQILDEVSITRATTPKSSSTFTTTTLLRLVPRTST